MPVGRLLIAAVLGYIIGAFPTGVVVTRLMRKPDVRFNGSGHVGGLNTYRLTGITGGVLTVLVDLGKGVLAAWLAVRLTGVLWSLPVAGVAAVIGHCWSLYVGLAGGMGLGTLGGLFLWQQPLAVLIGAALWGLGRLLLRDSPRAVMIMAVLMAILFWVEGCLGYASPEVIALGIGGVTVIFVRHLTQLRAYDQRSTAGHTGRHV